MTVEDLAPGNLVLIQLNVEAAPFVCPARFLGVYDSPAISEHFPSVPPEGIPANGSYAAFHLQIAHNAIAFFQVREQRLYDNAGEEITIVSRGGPAL